jgi:hypothetical protein
VVPNSRVPVLAFSLVGESNAELVEYDGLSSYAAAVGTSAIFGGQTVVSDFIADLLRVPLPVKLETTEFGFTLQRALGAYYDAYAAAARILGWETRVRPAEVQAILKDFQDRVLQAMHASFPNSNISHLRISLIKPFGKTSFRVEHSFEMENDPDDRLVFSNLTQGAPDAFRTRAPAFIDFGTMIAAGSNANMTKYEFALIRKALRCAICLPVFGEARAWEEKQAAQRPVPLGVASIDSDMDLSYMFNDVKLLESLAKMSLELSTILRPEA